jgi:hypothetical protein
MKCQVTGSLSSVALSEQFLVSTRILTGGTPVQLRSRSDRGIACNDKSCARCGAKNWPYRPQLQESLPSRASNCIGSRSIISKQPSRRAGDVNPPVTARQTRCRLGVECRCGQRIGVYHRERVPRWGRYRPIDIDRSPDTVGSRRFSEETVLLQPPKHKNANAIWLPPGG